MSFGATSEAVGYGLGSQRTRDNVANQDSETGPVRTR